MFYSFALTVNTLLENLAFTVVPLFKGITKAYQSYFVSYVKNGDPNTDRAWLNVPSAINWPHPTLGNEKLGNVLNVGDLGFSIISDTQNQKTACDFWKGVAAAGTNLGELFIFNKIQTLCTDSNQCC